MKTPVAASAADAAFGWNGSGLFFQTIRSFSGPYASRSADRVSTTLRE